MDNVLGVQVVEAHTHVNECLPDEVFNEGLAGLLLDVVAEVTVVAKLHHDVHCARLLIDEAVVVAHYKLVVQFFVLLNLFKRLSLKLDC